MGVERAQMYVFFSPSAELCDENFKPQPKYVKKCTQSGAVRGVLHNLGCLSIAPQAEEELSWAENERHKQASGVTLYPLGMHSFHVRERALQHQSYLEGNHLAW